MKINVHGIIFFYKMLYIEINVHIDWKRSSCFENDIQVDRKGVPVCLEKAHVFFSKEERKEMKR